MPAEVDDRYLKYVVARFAAYRNVWWSLANEYDLMQKKNPSDWDRYAEIVTESDPVRPPAFDSLQQSAIRLQPRLVYARGHAGLMLSIRRLRGARLTASPSSLTK